MSTRALLTVAGLTVRFPDVHGNSSVLDEVSFSISGGDSLGVVGESGCGKSLLGSIIAGLSPGGSRAEGCVEFEGRNLLTMSEPQLRRVRGRGIAMIYQDALSSLNPGMTVEAQLQQAHRHLEGRSPAESLGMVGLEPTRHMLESYPHQLSGGQRQRVLIALALTGNPRLLIADEPTTALDVTVEQQILNLLRRLQRELDFALVFISHDLEVVARVAERVVVMYAGQLVEIGPAKRILDSPSHHYSAGLLAASVSLEALAPVLAQIPGVVPTPDGFPAGCRFAQRCGAATPVCTLKPTLEQRGDGHLAACHHPIGELE